MDIDQILQQSREASLPGKGAALERFGKRILTGEDAAARIAASPGESFQAFDVDTGGQLGQTEATGDFGLAGNLLLGATAPITKPAAFLGTAGRVNQFRRAGRDVADFKPTSMSQREFQEFIENPLGSGAKAAATAATAFVPGSIGGGVSGLAKSGALGGALGGFGASEAGKELEGAATGGALGTVIGGGLGLLGRAIGSRAGNVVQEGAEQVSPTGLVAQSDDQFNAALEQALRQPAGTGRTQAIQDVVDSIPTDNPLRGSILNVAKLEGVTPSVAQPNVLQRVGRSLRRGAVGSTPDATPTGFQGAQRTADRAISVLDDFKQPVSSKGVNEAFNGLNSRLSTTIKNSKVAVNGGDIVSDALERAALEIDDVTRGAVGRAGNVLSNKLNSAKTVQDLADFKFELQNQMKPIFNKISRGGTLTEQDQLRLAFRNSADEALKRMVPETASILDDMSALHAASGDILKTGQKGLTVGSPLLGAQANLSGVRQRAQGLVGQVLEGQGGLPGGGLIDDAARGLQNIGNQPGAAAAAEIARRAGIPALAAETQRGAVEQPGGLGIETAPATQPAPTSTSPLDLSPQDFAIQAILAGYSPKEASDLAGALGIGGAEEKEMSATERKVVNQAQQGITALEDIEQLISEGGLATQAGAAFLPGFLQPGESKRLNNSIDRAAEMFGRIQSGGAINKDEEARFMRLLPQVTDDPDTIQLKLQRIRESFQGVVG
jgi:hypothetical protein